METATLVPSTKRYWSDNELMSLPRDGRKYELIEGDLLMSPVGITHSFVCVRLVVLLDRFVRRKKLGAVCDSSIGYRLAKQDLLSPDVSFVSKARAVVITVSPEKFFQGAPDLVIEVLSPGDWMNMIETKLDKYFEHGTRLAWAVDPKRRTVTVYTLDGVTKLSRPTDTLTGGVVLPGFRCQLRQIFSPR